MLKKIAIVGKIGIRLLAIVFFSCVLFSVKASTRLRWNFGDGNVSTATNPIHTYNSADTFTVSLLATDTLSSCTGYLAIDRLITTGYSSLSKVKVVSAKNAQLQPLVNW